MHTIREYYDFEERVQGFRDDTDLACLLYPLGIVYFDGSLQEGNEYRHVWEFLSLHTIAVEIDMRKECICLWQHPENNMLPWDFIYNRFPNYYDSIIHSLQKRYFRGKRVPVEIRR